MLVDYQNVNIYQEDKVILSNVNFQADEGEFIYFIGKVGSGKSSLLQSMYQEIDIFEADKAEILDFDLMTIRRKDIPSLRRQMGIVFQNFQLLTDRNVYKNLRFVLKATGWNDKKRIDQRIDEVLTAVGMRGSEEKYPHELSGGEQQRIGIARALLNNPKLILADEPTGNLDPETAENIIDLLKSISLSGTTVIMSTHNILLLDRFPGTVYQFKDGNVTNVTEDYNELALDEDNEEMLDSASENQLYEDDEEDEFDEV